MRLSSVLLLALLLVGCDRQSANQDATPEARSLDEPAVSRLAGLREFSGRLVAASKLGESKKNAVIAPLGWGQLLSALLSASEGETFEVLAATLGVQDPDTERLGQAHASLATDLEGVDGQPVRTAIGYWMVWPVPLKREFTALAEARYRVRFKNLGSAGIGSRAEIDEWTKRRTGGRIEHGVAGLAKSVPILASVAVSADFDFDGGTAPGGNLAFEGASRKAVYVDVRQRFTAWQQGAWDFAILTGCGGALELRLAVPPPGTRLDLAVRRLPVGPEIGTSPSEGVVRLPAVTVLTREQAGDWMDQIGLTRLVSGAVDFRSLSNEMTGTTRAEFVATTRVEWGGKPHADGPVGEPTMTVQRPFAFSIVHVKTGIPLFVGVVNDPTGP